MDASPSSGRTRDSRPVGTWLPVVVALLAALLVPTGPADAQSAVQHAPSPPSPENGGRAGEASPSTSMVLPTEAPADAALFYVADAATLLHNRPDSTAPVARLPVRTPLQRRSCTDGWCHVRTDGGRSGYVPASAISNAWVRVSKAERKVYLYRGLELAAVFKADVGYNTFSDKQRRGSQMLRDHWRTPEGVFYVVRKNPSSAFYRALVLNYPTIDDAKRGLRRDLISQKEHDAIVEAQRQFRMPPMDTKLGGWIEIHGEGTGAATTWTQGCVAVQNRDMNRLWTAVEVGTPVLIE